MRYSYFLEDKAYLQSYLNNHIWQKRYYTDFFPLKYTPTLDYNYLVADKGANIAANIVAYGSPAPEKTRDIVSKIWGEVAAIRVKRIMDESDINRYNIMKGQQNIPRQDIIDFVFDDTAFTYNAVEASREWLALQALSNFEISLTTTTNEAGVITQTTFDYQLPAANKRKIASATATRVWSNTTTSNPKPITDFLGLMQAVEDAGKTPPKYALMNTTTWRQFIVTDEVIDFANPGVFNQPNFVMQDRVNNALSSYGLPQIIVVNTRVRFENMAHTRSSATDPWTANQVVFLPEMQIGQMLHGPMAEQTNPPKQVTQASRNGILISKWGDVDPTIEITKAESNCWPVLPNVSNCWRLDVTATPETDGLDN